MDRQQEGAADQPATLPFNQGQLLTPSEQQIFLGLRLRSMLQGNNRTEEIAEFYANLRESAMLYFNLCDRIIEEIKNSPHVKHVMNRVMTKEQAEQCVTRIIAVHDSIIMEQNRSGPASSEPIPQAPRSTESTPPTPGTSSASLANDRRHQRDGWGIIATLEKVDQTQKEVIVEENDASTTNAPFRNTDNFTQRIFEEEIESGGGRGAQIEEVTDDEANLRLANDALNGGGNLETIQDIRNRVNNEFEPEDIVEEEGEGDADGDGLGERFAEGDGGFTTESGSTLTRRRARLGNDRGRGGARGGGSGSRRGNQRPSQRSDRFQSANIDEVVDRKRGFTNRELAAKAYGIGVDSAEDERLSATSERKRSLRSYSRMDAKAPRYGGLDDDDDDEDDLQEIRRTSSSKIHKSTVRSSLPQRSLSGRNRKSVSHGTRARSNSSGSRGSVDTRSSTSRN